MFELYAKLSKATDFFNSVRDEKEQLEYYEVLDMIEDRYNEKEIMGLIINLYSQSHWVKYLYIKGLKCISISIYPLGYNMLEIRITKNPPLF